MSKNSHSTRWAKRVTRNQAYDLGFHIGVRRTLKFFTEQWAFDDEFIASMLEERYFKEIKKQNK